MEKQVVRVYTTFGEVEFRPSLKVPRVKASLFIQAMREAINHAHLMDEEFSSPYNPPQPIDSTEPDIKCEYVGTSNYVNFAVADDDAHNLIVRAGEDDVRIELLEPAEAVILTYDSESKTFVISYE